ncbi:SigE family RNA polymerase sigma factor [Phytohabitans flavus]
MTQAMTGAARSGATARSPVVEQMTNDFDSFFRGRAPALLRTAYLMTGDKHLAEDLVQDALARTFRAWRRLSDGGNPEAYARRVMYHLQVSTWRRRRVVETMPGELPERRDHADHAHNAVERLALRRALQALPARQRAVVILRYFEDYSEAETADILNCRVGTVKSHTARALSKLRELMPEIELSEGVTR